LHHPLRPLFVRALEQPVQGSGDHLPGDAKAVGEPAALALFPALGECLPERIHLGLRFAVDPQLQISISPKESFVYDKSHM